VSRTGAAACPRHHHRRRSAAAAPGPALLPLTACSFVSFGEILMRKSVAGFGAVTTEPDVAYRWATLCFFGGMVIIAVLDRVSTGPMLPWGTALLLQLLHSDAVQCMHMVVWSAQDGAHYLPLPEHPSTPAPRPSPRPLSPFCRLCTLLQTSAPAARAATR
jgi:hypothetical protein